MEGLIFGILRYRTCSLCLRVALPPRGRSFCCRRLLHTKISQPVYQKCGPSPHFTPHFTWNSLNISRINVQRIFLRPAKIYHGSDSKVKMIITRKIARKLTRTSKENLGFSNISNPLLITLCTSLLTILLRCCVTERRAKTAGKTRNTTDFNSA